MKKATLLPLCLTCTALAGLLLGFAPAPMSRNLEARGSLQHVRLPLASEFQNASLLSPVQGGKLNQLPPPKTVAYQQQALPSLLSMEQGRVRMLSVDGKRPLVPLQSLEQVMSWLPSNAAYSHEEWMEVVLELAAMATEGDVLGSNGQPLRWDEGLLTSMDRGPMCLEKKEPAKSLSTPKSMSRRAALYKGTVIKYASKHQLDPALVLAIVHIESGFNPTLISRRAAHGLMQVVPHTAGQEVNRWLGEADLPSAAELLNPENNIRYGTAYMHLLNTRHLGGITNTQSREYCVVAAYNGGSGALLRSFDPNKDLAIAKINEMSSQDVLKHLQENHPALETRNFVRNVFAAKHVYMAEI